MRTCFSTKLSAGRSIFWHFSISWILYAHSECHTLQFCWLTSAHVLVLVFRGIVLGLSGFDCSKKNSPISCWSQWTYFLLFPFLETWQFLLFKKKKNPEQLILFQKQVIVPFLRNLRSKANCHRAITWKDLYPFLELGMPTASPRKVPTGFIKE